MNRIGHKHNIFGRAVDFSFSLPGIHSRRFVVPLRWWLTAHDIWRQSDGLCWNWAGGAIAGGFVGRRADAWTLRLWFRSTQLELSGIRPRIKHWPWTKPEGNY